MKRRTVGGRFTKREERIIEASDLDEDLNLKEELWERDEELSKDPSFLAHAKRLTDRARAFLRERAFPDCRGVTFSHWTPEEWEACEEMPDSVQSPRRWLPLDLYLRSYRKVRDDEPEDLAARIVCKDYILRRGRNDDAALWLDAAMWLAYELGELAALFHVYAQVDSQHENLSKRRWVKRDEAREKVLADWEKDPRRFRSAPKAAAYYSDWLAKEGYECEPSTVTRWIRTHARALGIKLK